MERTTLIPELLTIERTAESMAAAGGSLGDEEKGL